MLASGRFQLFTRYCRLFFVLKHAGHILNSRKQAYIASHFLTAPCSPRACHRPLRGHREHADGVHPYKGQAGHHLVAGLPGDRRRVAHPGPFRPPCRTVSRRHAGSATAPRAALGGRRANRAAGAGLLALPPRIRASRKQEPAEKESAPQQPVQQDAARPVRRARKCPGHSRSRTTRSWAARCRRSDHSGRDARTVIAAEPGAGTSAYGPPARRRPDYFSGLTETDQRQDHIVLKQ